MIFNRNVLAFDEASFLQTLTERGHQGRSRSKRCAAKEPDHRLRRLLRARCKRQRCRASSNGQELAPSHSITSSARASNVGGTAKPSAAAVLRLITNSYLVGACTGKSAGFSPLSIRST